MKKYDVIVIGGGPAGYKAAEKLAAAGVKTALADYTESNIGGTCLNEGCIPVKSFAESAHLYEAMKKSLSYGIQCGQISIDMPKVIENAEKNTLQLRQSVISALKKDGVELICGKAVFSGPHTVEVVTGDGKKQSFEADKFIIAAGSKVKNIPAFPINKKNIVTSREILKMETLPKSLLIIGGGAIGCEFASIYSAFGSSVTLVEVLPDILPGEDEEVSRTLKRELGKKGTEVYTECRITSFKNEGGSVKAAFESEGQRIERSFDRVLVAAGRVPNTDALGLENTGIIMEDGFIKVNERMQTNIAHIYAAGDVVKTPMFAHTAYREGIIAAESCLGINRLSIQKDNIPRIVFTNPQAASVGLTEKETSQKGEVKVKKIFFKSSGKALIEKNDAGFIKIITGKDGVILGASMIGPSVTELIHEVGLAIENKLTVSSIANFIHGHPTLSELIGDLALEW